jgi:hypothetical protein
VTDARETLNVVFKISPVTVFLMPDFDNGCRAYVLDGSGDDPYRANISLRYWSAHVSANIGPSTRWAKSATMSGML